jgi:hypothetical protein
VWDQSIELFKKAQQTSKLFERLRNKPFWIWDVEQHKEENSGLGLELIWVIQTTSRNSVRSPQNLKLTIT